MVCGQPHDPYHPLLYPCVDIGNPARSACLDLQGLIGFRSIFEVLISPNKGLIDHRYFLLLYALWGEWIYQPTS
jgi:hypothetical protein